MMVTKAKTNVNNSAKLQMEIILTVRKGIKHELQLGAIAYQKVTN